MEKFSVITDSRQKIIGISLFWINQNQRGWGKTECSIGEAETNGTQCTIDEGTEGSTPRMRKRPCFEWVDLIRLPTRLGSAETVLSSKFIELRSRHKDETTFVHVLTLILLRGITMWQVLPKKWQKTIGK